MDTISAVTSTGIYCRPGCSARPHPRNVRRYPLAAAAEAAGYRACLRCRPYRSEDATGWVGPEIVCRAVQLILAGALDGDDEAGLGARLGVSPRHLRRVFHEHLGVTPAQLARSRRAHFARRLLDDTDLTHAEIAFAAGFGSVRQYNRVLGNVFRATPRLLRARRRSTDRLAADGGLTLRLPFQGPLAWDTMLAYLAHRAIPGVEHASPDGYRRTILVDGHPGVIELLPGGADYVRLRAHLPHWDGLIHHVQRARRILNLDADVDAATYQLDDDPVIGALVQAQPGVRPPGTWDPFETGVRAILGQQVSVTGATTIAGRIVARHGMPVPGLGSLGLTHLFPAPAALADADLGGLGLTSARAQTVRGLATAAANGALPLDGSVGLDELVASVSALPGIGPWTAQYLALRLGEPDAFPATDLGLERVITRLAGPDVSVPSLADAWRPWRAHAAAHLWMAG